MWLSAAHIPGTANIEADKQSRILKDASEWKLYPAVFQNIVEKFGKPDIDLFATRINKLLDGYVSWHPEPKAMAINFFSLTWSNNYFYMFRPFGRVGRVLAKIHRDETNTQRRDKYSDSCTRLVNPILVPAVATDDQWEPTVISAITKKFGIATKTLCEPPARQKTPVISNNSSNSNLGNNTTEEKLEDLLEYQHIANIILILNNGQLLLKI